MPEPQALLERRDLKDLKAIAEPRALPVQPDHRVPPARKALRVQMRSPS